MLKILTKLNRKGTIYKAKWIDGPIEEQDFKNQQWKRWLQWDVALKKFDNNFASLNEDFLSEIAIHFSIRFNGITQDPETNRKS
ncbi:hypothetical protein Glove_243g49 [Diversispora epigaea]|uniref:Uncharacterized protein n=1 Tax=Diversispora epigaea TaxID=1348612 RepID=A0A397I9F6_9GLOM|nr:hypothetical protein Glove_243g49 [Diversispora epigaea]